MLVVLMIVGNFRALTTLIVTGTAATLPQTQVSSTSFYFVSDVTYRYKKSL